MTKPVYAIYDDIASWFDSARDKSLFEKGIFDEILRRAPAAPEILDLGCGSGEPVARYFIENGALVTGVDGAASMIAFCRERFPDHEWRHEDMRSLALNKKFDIILAWDSFFHLSCADQRAMFPVFKNHASKGCLLLFSSGWEEGEFWSPMRGLEETQMFHASLDTADYKNLLTRHGFNILRHEVADQSCDGRTYWLAQSLG